MTGDLARFREGKTDVFHYPHSANDTDVHELIVSRDGSILGATSSGVIGWLNGKQQRMTMQNGLPCDGVNTLLEDRHGSLWLYMQCGLVRIPRSEFERWRDDPGHIFVARTFDALDGVQPGLAPFQGASEGKDGKLWFVNGAILQMIDPDHLAPNPVRPPVHVEEIFVHGRGIKATNGLQLPRLSRDISIRYTALSFVAPMGFCFGTNLRVKTQLGRMPGLDEKRSTPISGPAHTAFA